MYSLSEDGGSDHTPENTRNALSCTRGHDRNSYVRTNDRPHQIRLRVASNTRRTEGMLLLGPLT